MIRFPSTLACALALAGVLPAQRIGSINALAPTLVQRIELAPGKAIEVRFVAITAAGGAWEKELADPARRDALRERIGAAAAASPLGRLETGFDVAIGGRHVARGSYAMAFTLDERFAWQVELRRADATVRIPLRLVARQARSRRLHVSLGAGDADGTAVLGLRFGDHECELAITPHTAKPDTARSDIVNRRCPLMDDAIDPGVTVTWKGKVIALCCEECATDWERLPAAKKDEHLARMLAERK